MQKNFILIILVSILAVLLVLVFQKNNQTDSNTPLSVTKTTMTITSSIFQNNKKIPTKYTCDGENVNPSLEFSDIPNDAESLVLIMDDPDAPAGTWTHWLIWNMPVNTSKIQENSVPEQAIEGKNTSGRVGYSGPCPPSGTHRYFFKLYALNTKLDLQEGAQRKDLEQVLEDHVISNAQLIGLYR